MRSKRSKAWHQRKDIQRARKLIEQGDTGRELPELMRVDPAAYQSVMLNAKWMVKVEHEV